MSIWQYIRMKTLDQAIHLQIEKLSEEGNALASQFRYEEAKKSFFQALCLVPEPHQDWKASTWLYVALGDMHFHLSNFEKCFRCFWNAVQCPEGLGNPFIHLRLGQSFFELGELDKAADDLTRAYMGGGLKIFMEDDPKYLEFLETKINM
jgi:tetratricopeptide (TPR) repeat protein